MLRRTERKHALLGAAFFFVAAAAAEGRIEAVLVQGLAQRLGEHDVGIGGAVGPWFDPRAFTFLVGMHQEFQAEFRCGGIAELEHFPEIPPRCDLQQRKRRLRGRKRLAREVQHHRAILAHRIEHHGLFTLRDHFAQYVNALGLEPLQIVERGHYPEYFAGVLRRTSSAVTPGASSISSNASLRVGRENTARSVISMSTTLVPVSGNSQRVLNFGSPSFEVWSRTPTTLLTRATSPM